MKSPDMKSVDVENVNILIGKLVSLLDSIQKTIAITKDPNLKKWLVFFDQKMLRQISFRVSAKNLTPEKLFESENAAACLNISRLKIQTALLSGNPNKYFDDVPQARRHFENISISWVFLKYSLNFVPGNDCEVEKEVYERFRLSF